MSDGDGRGAAMTSRRMSRFGMAAVFLGVGVAHFLRPAGFVAVMPSWVPAKKWVNLAAGAIEVAGGAALVSGRGGRRLGWFLAAFLVAVFPANVNMAVANIQIEGAPEVPRWALWARLPLQPVMIWAVLRATAEEGA